ncbi:MAG: response regulator transcription factor [Paracoccaceae bacterium]
MTQPNLLVVEDDPFHRKFLQDQLLDESFSDLHIVSYASGEDAIDWLEVQQADYAVVDLQLAGQNGVEVARNIWTANPTCSVVFWSNYSDPAYVRAIAKIVPADGNFGYLLKTTSPKKLIRSLQGVFFDRQRVVDSEIQGLIKRQNARSSNLTAVEIEVLNLVALGLTDRAIAKQTRMSARSVQSLIFNIYEELKVHHDVLEQEDQSTNRRCRLVALAILCREINPDSMIEYEARWAASQSQGAHE